MNQPAHMAVGQLGGVAFRLAGDGFNAQLIDFVGGAGRENHGVPELCKKGKPEGIIFIHIKNPGDAHRASFCLVGGKGFIAENPL